MSERAGPPPELYPLTEKIAYDRNQPPLTRELMQRFGGPGFLYNLRFWAARAGEAFYVPPEDHYRPRFETFTRTGVALRGDDVPLDLVFKALPMKVLRRAAKSLRAAKTVRTQSAAGKMLARIPGARAWLEQRYNVQDFFLLRAEQSVAHKEVETLWAAYRREACAVLGLDRQLDTLTINIDLETGTTSSGVLSGSPRGG